MYKGTTPGAPNNNNNVVLPVGLCVCSKQCESAALTPTTLLLYVSRLWRGLSVLLLLSWGVCGSNHDEEEGTIYISI